MPPIGKRKSRDRDHQRDDDKYRKGNTDSQFNFFLHKYGSLDSHQYYLIPME